jgi:hypothetical protein
MGSYSCVELICSSGLWLLAAIKVLLHLQILNMASMELCSVKGRTAFTPSGKKKSMKRISELPTGGAWQGAFF